MNNRSNDYVTRVLDSVLALDAAVWDGLLARQSQPTPFMRHAYLAALQRSGCASPDTGWRPAVLTLWQADGVGERLAAACVVYRKEHSYGEYVFDWAWANAYQQHGLAYYPKALVAVPFTPVPGSRLLAHDAPARAALLQALRTWCEAEGLSSLHLLFGSDDDLQACDQAGLMRRQTVQFHWRNVAPTLGTGVSSLPPEGVAPPGGGPAAAPVAPTLGTGLFSLPHEGAAPPGDGPATALARPAPTRRWTDFEDFLASLSQDKRKKIRQERRKVAEAGVRFRWARGPDIGAADWDLFYRCYERTYREHGNPPYLSRAFFEALATTQPGHWLLFVAERAGRPIATSLIALSQDSTCPDGLFGTHTEAVAYGRYWGALERVDCLHFEACYYQPLQWCIAHGVARFEGGAQGEHKMARALLPVATPSAHWLAHPAFADAVQRFLAREDQGMAAYLDELAQRSPLRQGEPPAS